MCETCGQDQKNCPGHIGHIEVSCEIMRIPTPDNPSVLLPSVRTSATINENSSEK